MHRQGKKGHYRLEHQMHCSITQAGRCALHATTQDVGSIIGEEVLGSQEQSYSIRCAWQFASDT